MEELTKLEIKRDQLEIFIAIVMILGLVLTFFEFWYIFNDGSNTILIFTIFLLLIFILWLMNHLRRDYNSILLKIGKLKIEGRLKLNGVKEDTNDRRS